MNIDKYISDENKTTCEVDQLKSCEAFPVHFDPGSDEGTLCKKSCHWMLPHHIYGKMFDLMKNKNAAHSYIAIFNKVILRHVTIRNQCKSTSVLSRMAFSDYATH